ncbi:hypothetical protein CSKR_113182 [Clonorchis sinensis]|uniref:Uncharacterized protein n=1 Tax=Clonorchis sinensis TaxID=79923 RepID=A0A3R7GS20_CLOSI|nr:hypothetical protein CSKR_113182 [Clonorchis sinensis]
MVELLPGCPSLDGSSRDVEVGLEQGTCLSSANLLTGRSVVRNRLLPLDFPRLGLDDLAVSQPSCFLLVPHQPGTERQLQSDDSFKVIRYRIFLWGGGAFGVLSELTSKIRQVRSFVTSYIPYYGPEAPDSSSGALIDCWSVRRAWQLDCKRFTTNRGDIVSAGLSGCDEWLEVAKWLKQEFANRKIRSSNRTFALRLLLSRPGQPGGIPALVLSSGGIAAKRPKGVTAESYYYLQQSYRILNYRAESLINQCYFSRSRNVFCIIYGNSGVVRLLLALNTCDLAVADLEVAECGPGGEMPQWFERKLADRKVRGLNSTSASRLPLSGLGQPGGIPALALPLGGMAARHRKGSCCRLFDFTSNRPGDVIHFAENSSTAHDRFSSSWGSPGRCGLRVSTNLMLSLNPNCTNLANYTQLQANLVQKHREREILLGSS